MADRSIDPDCTRRDDAPYWAAALALAIRAGDSSRAALARRELARLGMDLAVASRRAAKAVRDAS
jgi:hypothetical protein